MWYEDKCLLSEDRLVPLSKIPQFRIIGSKYRMLKNLYKVIIENKIKGKVFFDAFSGSAVVGRYFKKMFKIISNDNLYFLYILQRALITLNQYPSFKNVNIKEIPLKDNNPIIRVKKVLSYLNNLKDKYEGFIYQHYTPMSKNVDGIERKYFTIDNGIKIDTIRMKIEEWYQNNFITEDEYYYLIACLLFAVQKVANISGTYGAYNKFWDPRAHKPLKLRIIEVIKSNFKHEAYNEDTLNLIERIKCDIAYFDPPYNSRQYIANYHILETIARYDNPKISGKTGIRVYSEKEKSLFCSKNTALPALKYLIEKVNARYIILSYNSEGLLSKEEILKLLESSDRLYNIKFYEFPYRRFKSNERTANRRISEYVFFAEVREW